MDIWDKDQPAPEKWEEKELRTMIAITHIW